MSDFYDTRFLGADPEWSEVRDTEYGTDHCQACPFAGCAGCKYQSDGEKR